MKTELEPGERLDDLQINGYEIIQNPALFCFGIDAVLLAAFAHIKPEERVLDLGTGTGVLPILLAAKQKGHQFVGLEIQEPCAAMARRSVQHNHLEEQIEIVTGDLKEAAAMFGEASFPVVVTNPPYLPVDQGKKNQNEAQYIARHEVCCTLKDVLRESALVLPKKGRLYLIHRPERLTEILTDMHADGLEPKRMRLVYPYAGRAANLVLLEGVKGGKSGMTTEAPLTVYEADGSYTEELKELYGGSV